MSLQDTIFKKLDVVFRKGRMGPTITRADTVDRVNPILKEHVRLNHAYAYAVNHLSDEQVADRLNETQRVARADVGKLKETIFSCGGDAYNGTDMKEGDVQIGDPDNEILHNLHDMEQEFGDMIEAEGEISHQMRTRAIFSVVLKNSRDRLYDLKGFVKGRRRPASTK